MARDPRWLVLLSVRRTSTMERGWIETGEALHEAGGEPLWRVRGLRLSRDAGATGPTRQCVWDASAFVARASALVAVGRALHPELCEMISDIVPRGGSVGDSEPLQRAVGAFPPSEALDDLVPHFLPRVAIARLPGPGADLAGTGEGPWSAPPNRRSSASASPLAVVTMPVRERGRWFGE